ncbi:hypothetical protein [Haloarcula salinisoli]|uniref:Uncharacterized protein n=1 Tax=Haloarcula salinisoli TaxID=2487746 RepID=A0A8J7YK15_9EURY|nr:hypothetical protein [Halomicroarcula salinisoli]MBX0303246.1 hypothetical protein [Halomicroarcula salinisoli]
MAYRRRRFLVAIAAAAAGSAGCTSGEQSQGTADGPPTPQRNRLQVNVTYDEPGVEYIDANDTVRYTAGHRREGTQRTAVSSVVDFETWAYPRAAEVGAERVEASLKQRLSRELGPGVSVGYQQVDGGRETWEIIVFLTTTEDRNGSVVITPTVGAEQVAAETPRRVAVRLTVDSHEFRAEYPVRIEAVTQVRS